MAGYTTRAVVSALCLAAAPLWASTAQAGPPGSPGYCPGDGLMHDWDTGQAFAPCPIGGGLVYTPKGNVWVDRNGTVHPAATPQGQGQRNGPYPNEYSPDSDGGPNPRPAPVRPGGPPPMPQGNAGAIGGGP
ncbi:hypothetical protein [Segniliparus rugosus]|uniref:Uncharacterized protein n=1 Tax=Segniliparus rugosus (strain ATCC BAA-974 / DSM 45345 / CCUG 50838 / CIP 108380 / JCM 13579 / CDC 945) TaxID=679197 RepID=E5XTE2_SEGRC|nr:hypothetical protein [Segniliparus rugosus]EFV12404.1 hypothetical protein HMPREF9336_02764 [Segniliparus rugosus ATCC BAA-974]